MPLKRLLRKPDKIHRYIVYCMDCRDWKDSSEMEVYSTAPESSIMVRCSKCVKRLEKESGS